MKKQKLLSVALVLGLAATLVFANGGKEEVASSDEPVTLTCFVHTRPYCDDYENCAMTKWIEEETGVKLKFVTATLSEASSKLTLLLSTGDYPDLILVTHLNNGLQALYGGQGILLPLNDLIEKYSPNAQKVFNEYPLVKQIYTCDDGNIYNLPRIKDQIQARSPQKMWINQTWLDNLGLEMPKTTEEFYQVLKAFRDDDPNGNGIKDEIPLAGATTGWFTAVAPFLMDSFVYCCPSGGNVPYGFVKDDKVVFGFNQPEWKEGLKYLQKLCQEGLLATESFTQDKNGLKQMGANPDTEILGAFPGGYVGEAVNLSSPRYYDYAALEPLKGPNGVQLAQNNSYKVYNAGLSITDKCKNVEAAMKVADLLYGEKASMWNFIGREGIEWESITNSEFKGVDGREATWRRLIAQADVEKNVSWNQMGNALSNPDTYCGEETKDPLSNVPMLDRVTKELYEPHMMPVDETLPPMVFTEDETNDYLANYTSIQSWVEEYLATAVTSNKDVDATWDAYIQKINDMGYDDMMVILNKVYQRSKFK